MSCDTWTLVRYSIHQWNCSKKADLLYNSVNPTAVIMSHPDKNWWERLNTCSWERSQFFTES